ncbi:hypothetical protein NIES2101_37505 [Calothrix sp. HK-06]|nr:hypothetical protein NIES2101_37505 [Calothrix sp. HK-06]
MSERRRDFHHLNDLNLSSFWWHGTEWTSIIKDEITLDKNDVVESQLVPHKPIIYSAVAILVLLGTAIITRTGEISQRLETAQNQPQKIIFSKK